MMIGMIRLIQQLNTVRSMKAARMVYMTMKFTMKRIMEYSCRG